MERDVFFWLMLTSIIRSITMLLTPQLVAFLDVASMIHGSEHHHANDANHHHDDGKRELCITQCTDPFDRSWIDNLTTISRHPDNHQDGVYSSSKHHQFADAADLAESLVRDRGHLFICFHFNFSFIFYIDRFILFTKFKT